jgi:excisionase family DNA binding protein
VDDNQDKKAIFRGDCPFLNTAQAAHYLGLSPRTLQAMRWAGEGPPHRRHGRLVRYHPDELDDWSKRTRRGAVAR